MASIDERVVAMSFENAKFESGVAVTMGTLTKLNAAIGNLGKNTQGFSDIEKAGNKVTLHGPMTALDKLRQRLFGAGKGAQEGLGEIERAGNKVSLTGPLNALDKLRSRLFGAGQGATEGFNDIERASGKVTLAPLTHALDSVQAKFSGMTVAFTAALGTMVSQATLKAKDITNALTLGPITGGLEEYATNLNSIQTILANTQFEGANLQDVNRALNQLNHYSDQTIYNFSQMARNIGTFTAAGVKLEPAVASIKGIANLAALSGSSAEQASTAMYQLSQAIAAGRVSLQDWNSVVNAGMGGATFQRALVNTAKAMGTVADGAVKIDKATGKATINGESFRESITAKPGEKSWLTSDVLTNTLSQFTGDLTDAQLQAQGFNDEQIKAIQQTAITAKKAATEVKTLKGVFDVAKEAMGSGWAATFQIIFGNFTDAKKTFTDLSNAIQNMIGNAAKVRNEILTEWSKLGGRDELIKGIKAAFEALLAVLKPIRDAFRDIFPRKTGQDLFELTVRFREFMESLKIGPETADNLKRTFRGLFAALHIGFTVVKTIAHAIFELLGIVGQGSGGFLAFTGSIGDFVTALDKAISGGKGFQDVMDELGTSLDGPRKIVKNLADLLANLFDHGTGSDAVSSDLDALKKSLGPLGKILDAVNRAWEEFKGTLETVVSVLAPIVTKVHDIFQSVGHAIVQGLKDVNYDDVMTFIQTTFLGGIAIGVKKLLKGIGIDFTGGALDNFKKVTGTLTNTLTAIQNNVNARTMLLIAGAVLALAAASVIFAKIDAKKLARAMTAITVGLAQLTGAIFLLSKFAKGGLFLTLPFIATSMLILAAAMDVLAIAVFALSRLSWEELAKGLSGVALSLIAIGAATKLMGPSLILVGPGLIAVAIAMNLLAVSMAVFGNMDWGTIVKGFVGMAAALIAVSISIRGLGPSLILVGPGLILVSAGLILLAGAMNSFGGMSLWEIAKGLLAMGGALVVVGAAISSIPPTIALQAAGLVILGIALNEIAVAMGIFGSLKLGTIIKGLATMGATLVVFAAGLTAMSGTIPGSLALLGAATAFAILTPSLVVLGSLKWGTILKGLAAIALTLGVLAGVGALAAGPLTALGLALIVIGASVLLASSGIYLLAKGFALLGSEGTKGVSVMITAITALIALIPSMVISFVKGLADILEQLVKLAPTIAKNLVTILGIFLTALDDLIPKAAVTIGKLLTAIVGLIKEHAAPLAEAGFRLFLAFIGGLADNIGPIAESVGKIIGGFLGAMANNIGQIVAGGARFLINFLNGIAQKIPAVVAAGARVIVRFLGGMADKIGGIVEQAGKMIARFLNAVANRIPSIVRAGANIIVKFLNGIANALPRIIKSGTNLIIAWVRGISAAAPRIADAAFKAVIRFMNGMARAIRQNRQQMVNAGYNLASAIVEGLVKGMAQLAWKVVQGAADLAKKIPGKIGDILGVSSPSKVMIAMGGHITDGLAKGLRDGTSDVVKTMDEQGNQVVSAAKKTLGKLPALLDIDADPVIRPVLDLSLLEKNAGKYNKLVNPNVIPIRPLLNSAAVISQGTQETHEAAQVSQASFPRFVFEQNNTSPKALSTLEIYRQTKNQLSQLKKVTGLAQ